MLAPETRLQGPVDRQRPGRVTLPPLACLGGWDPGLLGTWGTHLKTSGKGRKDGNSHVPLASGWWPSWWPLFLPVEGWLGDTPPPPRGQHCLARSWCLGEGHACFSGATQAPWDQLLVAAPWGLPGSCLQRAERHRSRAHLGPGLPLAPLRLPSRKAGARREAVQTEPREKGRRQAEAPLGARGGEAASLLPPSWHFCLWVLNSALPPLLSYSCLPVK